MRYSPIAVTNHEIRELAACAGLQDLIELSPRDLEEWLKQSYLAKFDFVNGSPGYCGDLFLIQGDHLDKDFSVIRLIRHSQGTLQLLEDDSLVSIPS